MNTITMEIELQDQKLLNTLYTSLDIESHATKTERGEAMIARDGTTLIISINAQDLVAARAITNSIMRLLEASIDVAESIKLTDHEV